MYNKLPGKEDKPEYTPEEAALMMRLRVFVTMRWLAILGIIIATVVASTVFNIGFPTLPVYIICAIMALYNLVLLRQTQRLKTEKAGLVVPKARAYSNIHIFLDLITLTVLLHFTGGVENPLIFFFVFHIIMASIALPYRRVYMIATLAMVMVTLLVMLEYTGIIHHINLAGFVLPERYKEVSRIVAILAGLAVLLYATTYMATAISGELRKRQRQVVELREQLLEEKTRELEKSSQEIAKLEEEREHFLRFMSIAAHDLKAPLTAIQGFLWVMLGGYAGELNEKQKHMLERSSRRISELLELISDLLDIPRIAAGQKQITNEMNDISLAQVVRHSLGDLRNLAKQKGVELKAEIPQGLSKVHGSAPRLQRVITELLTNAINCTPEGIVSIRLKGKGKNIQVEVIDTGIGIPKEDIPKVFDEFFRASNVQTKGTGLGLSIVKSLIETHGGSIWVESPCPETNTGTKFTFTLPKKGETKRR